jgi:hypothetical protein
MPRRHSTFVYQQDATSPEAYQHYHDQRNENPEPEVFDDREVISPREPHYRGFYSAIGSSEDSRWELLQYLEEHDPYLYSGDSSPKKVINPLLQKKDESFWSDDNTLEDEGQVIQHQQLQLRRRGNTRRRPSKSRDYQEYRQYWRDNRSKYRERLREQRRNYRLNRTKILRQRKLRKNRPKGRHRSPKKLL